MYHYLNNKKEYTMKKIIFLIISLMILGCGGVDVPDDQQAFIDEWQRLKKIDDTSGGKEHLKGNRSQVVEWYGKAMYPNNANIPQRIIVAHKGVEYTLLPVWILEDDELNNMKSIEEGDKVYFTGMLNGEMSITLGGMLDEPEMNVKCSKLTSIDETIIYYDIPPERQVVIKTKSDFEKAVIGKWSGYDSDDMDDYGWARYGIMLELKPDFTFTEFKLKAPMSASGTAWKPSSHWESSSNGTWEIHRGNYSDTGEEYWAVKIHYSHSNYPWQWEIELTDFKNSIVNIFYDLRVGDYGPRHFLYKGDLLLDKSYGY
jgi:hypothetical protein